MKIGKFGAGKLEFWVKREKIWDKNLRFWGDRKSKILRLKKENFGLKNAEFGAGKKPQNLKNFGKKTKKNLEIFGVKEKKIHIMVEI